MAETVYAGRRHAAVRTPHFVFNQLIPYIGNKRKLLDLIAKALSHTDRFQEPPVFLDLFAGSGVVARMAKTLGFRVIANDWEPYCRSINGCYIGCNTAPPFSALGGYEAAIAALNALEPREDWVTEHLCPKSDIDFDPGIDRMFYMRKNGMKIDAVRCRIEDWFNAGLLGDSEHDSLLAPLLYQACYTSNTSGVFKGFHRGWGGQSSTALYRIASDLALMPAVLFDNSMTNDVTCVDAQLLAESLSGSELEVAYLDPPYNQHPYGSNYHVLNSVALWDKPVTTKTIERGTKSAIRVDWRTHRRSAYNSLVNAAAAYRKLLHSINAHYILTSYSTDGTIPLESLLASNLSRGHVQIEMKGYKRYRVSSQRFSQKPLNVEFVTIVDTHRKANLSVEELYLSIASTEAHILNGHRERLALA